MLARLARISDALLLIAAVVLMLAMLTAVATVAVILVEHRGLRLARRESIPHYYRRLVLAH